MIDLFRLDTVEEFDKVGGVGNIAEVEKQLHAIYMWILIEMVDPVGVKCR